MRRFVIPFSVRLLLVSAGLLVVSRGEVLAQGGWKAKPVSEKMVSPDQGEPSPNGKYIVKLADGPRGPTQFFVPYSLLLCDGKGKALKKIPQMAGDPTHFAFSPDSQLLALGTDWPQGRFHLGVVRLIDLDKRTVRKSFSVDTPMSQRGSVIHLTALAFTSASRDNKLLVAYAGYDRSVFRSFLKAYSPRTGAQIALLPLDESIYRIVVNGDDIYCVTDRGIRITDASLKQWLAQKKLCDKPREQILGFARHMENGKLGKLAVLRNQSYDQLRKTGGITSITILDGATLKPLHTMTEEKQKINPLNSTPLFHRLLFTPDGQRLVYTLGDRINVWDVKTGKRLASLTPDRPPGVPDIMPVRLRMTPDGKPLSYFQVGGKILGPQVWSD
jgi:WD40 repeat protein